MALRLASQAIEANDDGPRKKRKIEVTERRQDWTAILYKTMPSLPCRLVSDPTNRHELENFIKISFPLDEIMVDPESKRVGNSEGFNLTDRLSRMTRTETQWENDKEEQRRREQRQNEKIEELQQGLKEQGQKLKKQEQKLKDQEQKLKDQGQKLRDQGQKLEEDEYSLLMAHASELEYTGGSNDMEIRYRRNEIIHGGDIKVSIRAIAFLEKRNELSRAQYASIGFKKTYGIFIHELRPMIATLPEEIVELFNLRGTLHKLEIWRPTSSTETITWIKGCDDIIEAWLRAGGGSASDLMIKAKEEYAKTNQQMSDRRCELWGSKKPSNTMA